jgi:hypothetical protein
MFCSNIIELRFRKADPTLGSALSIRVKNRKLYKTASIHFVAVDMNDCSGEKVNPITPVGKIRDQDKFEKEFSNDLEWTMKKPKDGDYKGILLSSEKATIECAGSQFKDSDFVIDDFELNSPHAWKRMF